MIEQPEHLVVRQPTYLATANTVIGQYDIEDWKLYYKWHALSNAASYLSSEFEQENFSFYGTVLTGTTEQEPRWKRGVDLVNGLTGELVGKVYVKKHFPAEAKERMSQDEDDEVQGAKYRIADRPDELSMNDHIHYDVTKARHFMSDRCKRHGSSRYALKRLHGCLDPAERARGMIDLAVEAKYLSVVWHPNISEFFEWCRVFFWNCGFSD